MNAPLPATERLALSRERLRRAMVAGGPRSGASADRDDKHPGWLQGLRSIPGSEVLIEALQSWWAQHPLRVAGTVAADAANAVMRPLAQRHPMGLALAALVLGGVLVRSRAWRWFLTPALFAGLLPQLFSKAMALVPTQSWMAMLSSVLQEQKRPPPTGPEPSGPEVGEPQAVAR